MENVNQTMGTLVFPQPYSRHPLGQLADALGIKGLFPDKAAAEVKPSVLVLESGQTRSNPAKRCPTCNGPRTRSHCEYCLKKMAEEWKAESDRRRKHGQCCKCERKGVMIKGKRSVFCRFHREENRARSQAWQQANGKRRWVERKAAGVCVISPKHGPVEAPHAYCSGCRKRQRDAKRTS